MAVNDVDKDNDERARTDIINLVPEFGKPDRLAILIGVVTIILAAVGVIYISTWQEAYAKQFYEVKFSINYLEGVQAGMKIRYQGGVVVGEVLTIESDSKVNYLHSRIRNDFRIIKSGTKISLEEAGSFGGSYLNVSTIPYYFDKEEYKAGDVIPVAEITPFQVTLNNLAEMLESKPDTDSLLVKRVNDIRHMIRQVVLNKDLLPAQLRQTIHVGLGDVRKALTGLSEANNKLYKTVEDVNKSLNTTAENLRTGIPKLRNSIAKFNTFVRYNPEMISENQFMHDEQLYDSTLFKLRLINNLMRDYKESPYKLIFESGL